MSSLKDLQVFSLNFEFHHMETCWLNLGSWQWVQENYCSRFDWTFVADHELMCGENSINRELGRRWKTDERHCENRVKTWKFNENLAKNVTKILCVVNRPKFVFVATFRFLTGQSVFYGVFASLVIKLCMWSAVRKTDNKLRVSNLLVSSFISHPDRTDFTWKKETFNSL